MQEPVPHFALDVAGKVLPNGDATAGIAGHNEVEKRAESELDQEYTDAYDSSDVLRKATVANGSGSPLHDTTVTTITTTEDSCTGSELEVDTSSTTVEEKDQPPLQPCAMADSPKAVSSTESAGEHWGRCLCSPVL